MLPALDSHAALEHNYRAYLDALLEHGFSGEIESAYSSRLAVATDNSIYQRLPQAVVFPKSIEDLSLVGRVSVDFPDVKFSPRGGGTGTNGQSLTSGVVVDVSRHMNGVLEINPEEGWVRVQAGVVKDQLNDALRPHGFFFAPDLSTSNRATIGGMINTDASGQGSLVYGKTSDHVLGLKSVLADGTILNTEKTSIEQAESHATQPNTVGRIMSQVISSCRDNRQRILETFPRLNRFLTGYDLENVFNQTLTEFDLSRIITGSEGSLAFVAEAKLNVTPIAKHKALVNIKYDSFESALRHAPHMVAANATSVETVDSKVLNLAREDIIWHSVSGLIEDVPGKDMLGLNMVEYNSNDQQGIESKIAALSEQLDAFIQKQEHGVIGYQVTFDTQDISKIYAMRKKAVGLLGKAKGWQKPIAFAEDTAVPPENLADFILEFRALLDEKGLAYGMFGHVDAGVLHVRPALDMCDLDQQQMMQDISDQVVALVAKYGGLMWGEHGKGYRSEYGPAFFGDVLFTELRKIKTAFDPLNKMNPGKICTPLDSDASLVRVSDLKRGDFDRQIPIEVRNSFEPAMSCNGNGLCFNYDSKSIMCPSSKITRDRRHSPKGRAGMVREWLRLLSKQNVDIQALEKQEETYSWFERLRFTLQVKDTPDFSHEVKEVMDQCLACKACATQCPVNVDVPGFRARFLNIYHQRYMRPMKDHLVANIEVMAPYLAKMPKLVNFFLKQNWVSTILRKHIGYVDSPLLSIPTLDERMDSHGASKFDLHALGKLDELQKRKTVLIVQDPFTSFYEAELIENFIQLAEKLGYSPVLLPFKPNGKPQHVKGFLQEFAKTANDTAQFLNQVSKLDIPMVGLDASLVLCYRDEYTKTLGSKRGEFNVLLAHEWLETLSLPTVNFSGKPFALFAHCTEKTALPTSEKAWQSIFTDIGAPLDIVSLGCCGMAGTFGHEAKHLKASKGIYDLSWQNAVGQYNATQILATGYSCRSQVQRFEQFKPKHPIQAMLAILSNDKKN
ncbi:FAD-binding oxidoreductase [Aestuariibacter sp. AA17]|uniref:FAD-binding oxidoreductase n=1 Tax=Fluctibacter corallii TaxID=2984329 RepID=A0ABT3A5N2_9ALTE|nr:FAD-binding and (Fe-S)-binding domain-containing protein [Aestuariibacter sp. AA17]MCV2883892.1 FAD-binding oxidoreductase [Aestuariibacter sp. AA17]